MMTQAATAAPAMALAGTTPLPLSGVLGAAAAAAAVFPLFTPSAPATALLGLADGDWDRVPVEVEVAVPAEVAVPLPLPLPLPLPVAAALGDASGVGASLDPVGVPVAELDGTIYRVPVAVLLGYAVGLALFATTEGVWV